MDWLQAANLASFVDWHTRRTQEVKVIELQETLYDAITSDPPSSPVDVLALVKARKAENNLPDRCGTGTIQAEWAEKGGF